MSIWLAVERLHETQICQCMMRINVVKQSEHGLHMRGVAVWTAWHACAVVAVIFSAHPFSALYHPCADRVPWADDLHPRALVTWPFPSRAPADILLPIHTGTARVHRQEFFLSGGQMHPHGAFGAQRLHSCGQHATQDRRHHHQRNFAPQNHGWVGYWTYLIQFDYVAAGAHPVGRFEVPCNLLLCMNARRGNLKLFSYFISVIVCIISKFVWTPLFCDKFTVLCQWDIQYWPLGRSVSDTPDSVLTDGDTIVTAR